MRKFGRFLLWVLAGVGGLTVTLILAVWFFTTSVRDEAPDLPDLAVLHLDLNAPVSEHYAAYPLFKPVPPATFLETVTAIDRSAGLDQVKALVVDLGYAPLDMAHAQELVDAVRRFRASGKPAYAYAEDLAVLGDSTAEVMLAAAFDSIWMAPSGMVGLTGFALEIPYAADGLAEIGVRAEFEQRYEYKGGADPLTKSAMPEPVRRTLTAWTDDMLSQAVSSIARDRGLDEGAVRDLIDQGPLLAAEAKSAGLIDELDYLDGFDAMVDDKVGADADWIGPEFIIAATGGLAPGKEGAARVAVLYGIGPISAEQDHGPFDDRGFDPYGLIDAIQDIADAKGAPDAYDAVLFRVDSPGGAYGPSNGVWKALGDLSKSGTPVVVSMGGIAGSGGYFVSMAANRILAQPGTLTGSIGVYGGKFDLSGLWQKLGVRWDQVKSGAHAGMWSSNRALSPGERDRLAVAMDFVYADFTTKAAKDRGLDATEIDQAARGRVWSGEDALGIGLIDRLGGFDAAQDEIRSILDLPPASPLDLIVLPAPKKAWEAIAESLESGDFDVAVTQFLAARVAAQIEPITGDLTLFRDRSGLLAVPPFRMSRANRRS